MMNNYDDILREKENNELFKNDAMEKHWAALENKLGKPNYPSLKFNKGIKLFLAAAAIAIIAFLGFKFLNNKNTKQTDIALNTEKKSAIKPPLTWANLPYETFTFDAQLGDTLFTQNGSIIIFPANALLNSKGEIVKGNIEIKAREFNDALDYSIAGIPMGYDSAGVKYTFISSGMIDINAYQKGENLQVNPNAKPTLNLVSTNKETNTNLYKLDTITGVWQNKGKDVVKNIGKQNKLERSISLGVVDTSKANKNNTEEFVGNDFIEDEIVKPLAPQKPSNKNPIINIEFVPGSFKELAIYDGLKFEVISLVSEVNVNSVVQKTVAPRPTLPKQNSNPIQKIPAKPDNDFFERTPSNNTIFASVEKNSKTDWENIELVKTNIEGEYKVIFTSGQQKVVYVVKPVLEGNAFVEAEKKFQQKMKEYETEKNNRLQELTKTQQQNNRKILNDSIADEQIIAQNNKTTELNKIIEKRNELVEARNKFIEEQNKLLKERAIIEIRNRKKLELEYAKSTDILRTFEIDGFGYWNCDKPTVPQPLYINATFLDKKNKTLEFNILHVAVQNVNRLISGSMYSLPFEENKTQCVFAFANNKFYYLSYSQFAKLNITKDTKTFNFILIEFEGDKNDYGSLKKVLVEKGS